MEQHIKITCTGCGKVFDAYRSGLPANMIGYCQNTGKQESMLRR